MKKTRPSTTLVLAVLVAGGLACCNKAPSSGSAGSDGYHLICTKCDHSFVVAEDKIGAYPADPNGGGFRCEKCGALAARIGHQCSQCKKWYIAESRGMPCPHCAKDKAAQKS